MKITYRPEIDGLRAIAVSAVILYHAQITILGHQPFKGGFIGVDIFFVISGYLITSIILKELVTTGSFSFKHFYERRIRRILPALLFVMLVSLPFAWMYLLPSSFVDFSKSILYSLGFSSNFYFHYSGQQYGAESGLLKPFLHTWSLSVEEQFYIFFPIILLITFKYLRKYFVHILIIGFVVSLGLAEWTTRNYPSVSFYFLHTRMWELLVGSILAYFEIINSKRSENKILNSILPISGLLLIVLTIIFFKTYFPHPSLHSLPAVIGVCLIIWFSDPSGIVSRLLSTKLFVGIGLISYSLYLWHYPIFAFARINYLFEIHILFYTIILFILSITSFYFIEKPARNKNFKFRFILISNIIIISILIILNLNVIFKDGFKDRVPSIIQNNYTEDTWNQLKNDNGEYCFDNLKVCRFNKDLTDKIYLLGDSHISTLSVDLKSRVTKKRYQFITSLVGGCIYFPNFDLIRNTGQVNKNCNNEYFQKIKKDLLNEKSLILITGGRLPLYISNYFFDNEEGGIEKVVGRDTKWDATYIPNKNFKYDSIQISFKNEISELSKKHKVILIYPIPEVGLNPKRKIFVNLDNKFSKEHILDYFTTSYEVYKKRTKSSFDLLDSIQGENIYRVYPHTLFCDTIIKDRCVTHDDKNIFYADDDHPSLKGAEMINDLIIKEIEKIELKSN
jgi:peptidoglycan/LPS O-acetylase OafA/YrhL